MNRINILDDLTINKIAAGEVVERPSSIVKELVENCVDANSSKIIIDIIDGGKKSIKITDNGSGISSSEVDKSFLRHATSKIEKIDDLYNLYSLGFRGEALASISSICKLEMVTKTKEECVGTKVIVEGGKVVSKQPIGANNGTTMIIKDVFYNTPVRQKFLKSTHAETINISDLINKLAIGNPHIQFKYVNNGKAMLNTPGDSKLISVIRSIYGKDVCENLIEIEYECKNFKINGYIGNNNVYRSNKNLQHIYINKRFVKSKVILDAVAEAYKAIIPINKHCVCFLNMELNPASIDVNIHPTKLEIKFENEQELYIELRDFLKHKLLNSKLIGKYEVYDNKKIQHKSIQNVNAVDIVNTKIDTNVDKTKNIDIKNNKLEYVPYKTSLDKNIEVVELDTQKPIDTFLSVNDILSNDNKLQNLNNYKTTIDNENIYELGTDKNLNNNNTIKEEVKDLQVNIEKNIQKEQIQEEFFQENKDEGKFSLRGYSVIGILFDTYIILSKGSSMYLLDQHAAHERVLYEKYMDKFYKSEISMQMLLDPIVLELSNVDMLQIEKNLELFIKFGFEIEIFGNNHIMIRCVPTIFGVPESEKFILQIIDNIDDINSNYELKGEKFASMACRAAIKANDKIQNLEINSLFKQIEECINPFTCPHGRPIMVEISKNEIEKMFKRIM